jgi:hypothetical protein
MLLKYNLFGLKKNGKNENFIATSSQCTHLCAVF